MPQFVEAKSWTIELNRKSYNKDPMKILFIEVLFNCNKNDMLPNIDRFSISSHYNNSSLEQIKFVSLRIIVAIAETVTHLGVPGERWEVDVFWNVIEYFMIFTLSSETSLLFLTMNTYKNHI